MNKKEAIDSIQDFTYDPFLFEKEDHNHAEFLQKQGEVSLVSGDPKGVRFFELASKIEKGNAFLLFRQGEALYKFGKKHEKKKFLLMANKKFKESLSIDQDNGSICSAWGDSLYLLGEITNDYHFYLSAKDKYLRALDLEIDSFKKSKLYWHLAKTYMVIARQTRELDEKHLALKAFMEAEKLFSRNEPRFWTDYGIAYLMLFHHINDPSQCEKAMDCFRQAISIAPEFLLGWDLFAETLLKMYQTTHDQDLFDQANECLQSCNRISPDNEKIWNKWATLFFEAGTHLGDRKKLIIACDKCKKASLLENSPEITLVWIKALTSLALLEENFDYILNAHNKLQEGIETFGHSPVLLLAHGIICHAEGEYYEDSDYYFQAIEKFQEGLSIDRTVHELWRHMALSYRVVAAQEKDSELLALSCRFYAKAISFSTRPEYFYEYAIALYKRGEALERKNLLEIAILNFEHAFSLLGEAIYLHAGWLFHYAIALKLIGSQSEDHNPLIKSAETFGKVIMLDPNFPGAHYQVALVYSELAELTDQEDIFIRALRHYKLAHIREEENDQIFLDWALTLINLAAIDEKRKYELWADAEHKLLMSAKLGEASAYYHLACLYSLMEQNERAMLFIHKAKYFDALPSVEDLLEDEWLENLRNTESFKAFLEHQQK